MRLVFLFTTSRVSLEARVRYGIDPFWTPEHVAIDLFRMAPRRCGEMIVADFTAGEGDLLRAAADCWPDSRMVAADIDEVTVRRLRRKHPEWSIGVADFLDPQSRARSRVLRSVRGKVGLLLLNPPFSCRGGKKIALDVGGERLCCSLAMAFILIGKEYLRDDGEIRAILPAGAVSSQKDAVARAYLNRHAAVSFGAQYDRNTFVDCYPQTVLVRAKFGRNSPQQQKQKINGRVRPDLFGPVRIVRGSIQMHSVCESNGRDSVPLLHTTQLKNGFVWKRLPRIKRGRSEISGPAVLMPRVGRPTLDKLVFLSANKRIALSDCVFALTCDSHEDVSQVYEIVKRDWSSVRACFGGTGAPYLTLGKLAHVLGRMGISVKKPEGATLSYARSLEHSDP